MTFTHLLWQINEVLEASRPVVQ